MGTHSGPKAVLTMCWANPGTNPRPNRLIRCLKGDHAVTVVGLGEWHEPGVEYLPIATKKRTFVQKVRFVIDHKLKRYEDLLWSEELQAVKSRLLGRQFDVIVSHDLSLLPLAHAVKHNARIVFDAREYYPTHFEDQFLWRFLFQGVNEYLCRRYLPKSDLTLTVSDGIAAKYGQEYGVLPKVVQSWPDYQDLEPSPVDPHNVKLIHHGNATPSRRIEIMIRMMDFLDRRFTLDLMLMPNRPRYLEFLRKEVNKRTNIRLIPPVPYREIVRFVNDYDIGVYLLQPITFNVKHALPNKFFEFVQARLAVAIGPSPEMKAIAEHGGFGIAAADFEPQTLARLLNHLTCGQISALKQKAHTAASHLTARHSCEILRGHLADLLGP